MDKTKELLYEAIDMLSKFNDYQCGCTCISRELAKFRIKVSKTVNKTMDKYKKRLLKGIKSLGTEVFRNLHLYHTHKHLSSDLSRACYFYRLYLVAYSILREHNI